MLCQFGIGHAKVRNGVVYVPLDTKDLFLPTCEITELLPGIGKLTELEKICLFDNYLKTLPEQITRCTKVYKLNLSRNYINRLPHFLKNLKEINQLHLGNINKGPRIRGNGPNGYEAKMNNGRDGHLQAEHLYLVTDLGFLLSHWPKVSTLEVPWKNNVIFCGPQFLCRNIIAVSKLIDHTLMKGFCAGMPPELVLETLSYVIPNETLLLDRNIAPDAENLVAKKFAQFLGLFMPQDQADQASEKICAIM